MTLFNSNPAYFQGNFQHHPRGVLAAVVRKTFGPVGAMIVPTGPCYLANQVFLKMHPSYSLSAVKQPIYLQNTRIPTARKSTSPSFRSRQVSSKIQFKQATLGNYHLRGILLGGVGDATKKRGALAPHLVGEAASYINSYRRSVLLSWAPGPTGLEQGRGCSGEVGERGVFILSKKTFLPLPAPRQDRTPRAVLPSAVDQEGQRWMD